LWALASPCGASGRVSKRSLGSVHVIWPCEAALEAHDRRGLDLEVLAAAVVPDTPIGAQRHNVRVRARDEAVVQAAPSSWLLSQMLPLLSRAKHAPLLPCLECIIGAYTPPISVRTRTSDYLDTAHAQRTASITSAAARTGHLPVMHWIDIRAFSRTYRSSALSG
jgi:hypothetical protein